MTKGDDHTNAAITAPHDRGRSVVLRRVLPAVNAIFLGHVMVRLGSLVLVPLFLRYWSPISYGEYLVLFAAVAYLGSLDIGIQWAAVNRLTQAYARNDLDEYRTVQHSCLFFFFSSRRRHTRSLRDWSSDVCSSDLRSSRGRVARRWRKSRAALR